MGKHLKTKVIERLKGSGFEFVPLPAGSTPHKRGVYYCHMCAGVDFLLGAMDSAKEGCKYKKRIRSGSSFVPRGLERDCLNYIPSISRNTGRKPA